MEGKKSFVLYADLNETVKKLLDEEAGQLFKMNLSYVSDENPETENRIIDLLFDPIKRQLKRDLLKWESSKEARSESGRIGNLKRWSPDLYQQVIEEEITLGKAENIAKSRKSSPCDNSDIKKSQSVPKIAVPVSAIVTESEIVRSKIAFTSFSKILKDQIHLTELESKGFSSFEVLRTIDRFIDRNTEKVFDSPEHLKNTFLKFMNKKERASFKNDPKKYKMIVDEIYCNQLLNPVLNEFKLDSTNNDLHSLFNQFEDWLKVDSPIIENGNHVINKFREYLNKRFTKNN